MAGKVFLLCFPQEDTEVQRGEVLCPKLHCQEVGEVKDHLSHCHLSVFWASVRLFMEMPFQPCSWQEEGEARNPWEDGVSHEIGWQRVIRILPQITGTMYPLYGLLLVAPDLS